MSLAETNGVNAIFTETKLGRGDHNKLGEGEHAKLGEGEP
jgi:hypothetical protein